MAGFFSSITLPEQLTLSYAIGRAAGDALTPFIYDLINEANAGAVAAGESRPLPVLLAAGVAAEDVAAYDAMEHEASFTGFDSTRFRNLYGVALSAPGMGELLQALRRGTITETDFTHGLRKARYETRWDSALEDLRHVRLTPQQIALGIVRSVVRDPGLLATTLDLSGGIVPAYPEWPGDALAEAQAGGIDADRLRVMVGEIGLPMSAQQAASAYFRGIIEHGDYNRAILEGDTRPEWAPYILDQARQILTVTQYAEAELRGFTTEAQRRANTAKHGMSQADSDLLFNVLGRGLAVHAVTTALARGGKLGGTYADVPEPYRSALQRSNIRPEWAGLAYANRYTYPSAFVLRSLAQAGELGTTQDVEQILLEIGWKPELAAKVAPSWAPTGSTGDTHVTKAEGQLWTTTHRSYIAEEIDDATASAALGKVGVAVGSIPSVLSLWGEERSLIRKQLTPAQIRKALNDGITNPATGAPWTIADAQAAMLARGYSQADAQVFLQE